MATLPDSVRSLLAYQALPLPDSFWAAAVNKVLAALDRVEGDIARRENALTRATDTARSKERELDRLRRQESEGADAVRVAEARRVALEAELRDALAEEQRCAERKPDEAPAYLAGPPRPRTGSGR